MQKIFDFITNSRVWKSFFRHGWPDNPLDRSLIMTTNVFFHLHPVKVSRKSLKWTYSFGLGIISAIAFGLLTLTGILLMFYYAPTGILSRCRLSCPLASFCATCTAGGRI